LVLATLTFLVGIAMIGVAFWRTWVLLDTPFQVTAKVQPDQLVDAQATLNGVAGVVVKILGLALLAWVGGLVATKGIKLFETSMGRHILPERPAKEK
jgi:hypothetical protein